MNVLIITPYFPLPGNPVMGLWAMKQAQALQRAGHDVTVVAPLSWVPRAAARMPATVPRSSAMRSRATAPRVHRWDGLETVYPRWPVYHVGPQRGLLDRHPGAEARLGWLRLGRLLTSLVRERRIDVVYAHGTGLAGYLAMRLKRATGAPFVSIDHELKEITDCGRSPARLRHYAAVAREASMMLSISSRMERETNALLAPPRMRVLAPVAADPVETGRSPVSERSRPPVIFSAGGFYRRKAFPALVQAFARMAPRHPEVVLRIAGDGRDRKAVDAEVVRAGISDRVDLLGFVSHERILREMARCDVFALVGWHEGKGAVFIEALAAGKPLVWASDGGINDFVQSGRHGLAVRPGSVEDTAEALDSLLSDPEGAMQMGEEGRSLHRARFTWEANAERLGALFYEAAGPRG